MATEVFTEIGKVHVIVLVEDPYFASVIGFVGESSLHLVLRLLPGHLRTLTASSYPLYYISIEQALDGSFSLEDLGVVNRCSCKDVLDIGCGEVIPQHLREGISLEQFVGRVQVDVVQ